MTIEILVSKAFEEALQRYRYPKVVWKVIGRLLEDPGHPPLKAHKMTQAREGIWIGYISDGDRILYEFRNNCLYLWNLGDHTIERVNRRSFPLDAPLTSMNLEAKTTEPLPVVLPPSPSQPLFTFHPEQSQADDVEPSGSSNAFAFFQTTHLRVLGVPTYLVQSVRNASSIEKVLELSELSERTRLWLEELSTSPDLASVMYDSSRLLFRTTLDRLEGFCEGKIKRLMLNLQAPEQQKYVDMEHAPLMLLKGVAGSGKTTVGIYRAIRLAEKGRRVLVLTFNPILASATQSLIEELIGPLPANLRVMHLQELMRAILYEYLPGTMIKEEKESYAVLEDVLAEMRRKHSSPVLKRATKFFQEEIKYVIKGFGIKSLDEYKRVERYGRKTAFGPTYREVMWQVYEAYRRRFLQSNTIDYLDMASRTLEVLQTHPQHTRYDDAVVDEVQDLTLVDLGIVQQLVERFPYPPASMGSILLLADAAQTLYSRGFSWKKAGIAARGHTWVMRKNHRNTRQIVEAANHLLQHNTLLRMLGEYIDPETIQRQGPLPVLMRASSTYNQVELALERILDLISDQTVRPADIAILCPDEGMCIFCEQALQKAGLRTILHSNPKFDMLDECIKIMPISSAKGLEFPVVFLLGLTSGQLPSRQGTEYTDTEEARLHLEQQRALCYVGMTRAAEALYMITTKGAESIFVQELAGKVAVWE